MELESLHLLSLMIFLPLAGALMIGILPAREYALARGFGLAWSGAVFILGILLWLGFDPNTPGLQFVEKASWIPSLGIGYHLAVDGLSLPFILLTAFIVPLSIVASIDALKKVAKGFVLSVLLFESAALGAFASQDLFLFYIFSEFALIPLFVFIAIWGDRNRSYSAIKLFLYPAAASCLLLVAMLWLYFENATQFKSYSTDLATLAATALPQGTQMLLFSAFAVAFMVRSAIFPFHSWLTDAIDAAPPAATILIPALLLKLGLYGMARVALPLFPLGADSMLTIVASFAVVGFVWCALAALAQKRLRRMVAYLLASQMGLAFFGLAVMNVEGVSGAFYLAISHGIAGTLLLIVVGLYERANADDRIDANRHPLRFLPWLTFMLTMAALGLGGLPVAAGFPGVFYVLYGAIGHNGLSGSLPLALISVFGLLVFVCGLAWMVQRMVFGSYTAPERPLRIKLREYLLLVPLALLILLLGLFPSYFVRGLENSATQLVDGYRDKVVLEDSQEEPQIAVQNITKEREE